MLSALDLLNRKDPAPARQWLPSWRTILGLELILLATAARAGEPVSPARELQKLIPPDASVVLTVEDLRGQVRELLASRLAAEFPKLPTVKAWFDSEKYEQLETARDQIEGVLQAKLTEIRDQIVGDAVVLALRLPPDSPFDPSQARGILALKAINALGLLARQGETAGDAGHDGTPETVPRADKDGLLGFQQNCSERPGHENMARSSFPIELLSASSAV